MIYRKNIPIDYNVAINKLIKKLKMLDGVVSVRLSNDEIIIESNRLLTDEMIQDFIVDKPTNIKEDIFYFDNIDCPNCASKVERALNRSKLILEAQVIFLSNKIIVKHNEKDIYNEVCKVVTSIEKDTNVFKENKQKIKEEEKQNNGDFVKKLLFIIGVILFLSATLIFILGNEKILGLLNLKPLISGLSYLIPVYLLYLLSYGLLAYDLLYKSIYGILHKDYFNESLLMVVASLGAIVLSFIGEIELFEACAVVLLYKIGESLQDKATEKSKEAIKGLINLKVDTVLLTSGESKKIEDIKVGEKILVKVGEKVPLDGKIIKGNSNFDMKILTGESEMVFINEGEEVLSGAINLTNAIEVEVCKEYEDSTISKVKKIIEEASEKKANAEQFITKFARVYTPIVLILAVVVLIIQLILRKDIQESFNNVFAFLVISCPCSLVISIPLAYFASIGRASKEGILIKGGNYLECLTNIEKVVFDKTGTLTEGNFEVVEISSIGISKEEFIDIVCKVEAYSNHPIAKFITSNFSYLRTNNKAVIEEIAGLGIKYEEGTDVYLVGNEKLMEKYGVKYLTSQQIGTHIYVSKNGIFLGNLVIRDKIKDGSKKLIEILKLNNIISIMLTGDKRKFGEFIADSLNMDEVHSELLPQDKYNFIDSLVTNKKKNIVYVGDGINDTPSLRRSDVGIAIGGIGSDLAKEAADVVIMSDDILKVNDVIVLSRLTKNIIIQNIVFILVTKLIAMLISGLGLLDSYAMLVAIFADVGVCLICILNSLRILKLRIRK